jgi:predicted lipoprotein with Yx(FWY)xxD motif
MTMTRSRRGRGPVRPWAIAGSLVAAAVALAACSTKTTTGTPSPIVSTSPPAAAPSSTPSPSPSAAPVTISSAAVPGVGTVLVNAEGRTLYVLSSEAGGKVTCTDESGCTKIWPDNELPKGQTGAVAGTGVQAAKLGTAMNAKGDLYVTYATYPLYTFSQDPGPGVANGVGITSFGGTWYPITPAGTLVKAKTSTSTSTTKSPAAGGGVTHAPSPSPAAPSPTGYHY